MSTQIGEAGNGKETGALKLMEAMNGIKPEYLEAAGAARKVVTKEADNMTEGRVDRALEQNVETAAGNAKKKGKVIRPVFWGRIAAAALAVSIILPNTSAQVAFAMQRVPVVGAYFRLVTFRDYSYEDDNHSAEVSVSGITVDEEQTATSQDVAQAAQASAEEINREIQETTDSLIAEFKETLKEDGYSTLDVSTQTVTDNDKWYVLKLSSFQAAGSGYEESHYYVISRKTGERVHLADLFKEESDYRKVISEEIIRQMKEKEAEDPANMYWLDEEEYPDFNFTEIAEDQNFYINNEDQLVIAFQEGEVGPMSMGEQEFVIPDDVIDGILADTE